MTGVRIIQAPSNKEAARTDSFILIDQYKPLGNAYLQIAVASSPWSLPLQRYQWQLQKYLENQDKIYYLQQECRKLPFFISDHRLNKDKELMMKDSVQFRLKHYQES